jgi:isopenicillin-N epimerase
MPPTKDAELEGLGAHWMLDPDIVYLNHGSFGATPRVVFEKQTALRQALEREPVRFFMRDYGRLVDEARGALADLVCADPDGLAFVPNATFAVNSVVRSFDFEPGDEILVTDHGYNACRNAAEYVAQKSQARVVVAQLPFVGASEESLHAAIMSSVTEKTRLALLDLVTSPTALILPLARLVRDLEERGVATLIDGAHGVGMLDLNIDALSPAFFTSNCHKWLCAPKGSAFMWVRGDWRKKVRPAVISHGANAPDGARSRYHLEFDWIGTVDPTPWLSVPAAIDFMKQVLPGGMAEVQRRNHALVLQGRQILMEALGVPSPCPDSLVGSMAALALPDGKTIRATSPLEPDPLQNALFDQGIEVPIIPWPARPHRLVRISAQLYNQPEDYRRLAEALVALL